MKSFFLILFVFLLPHPVSAQFSRKESDLGLSPLSAAMDTFHLRIWDYFGQVIDIWTNDYAIFGGSVTNYIYKESDNGKDYSKITLSHSAISTDSAKQVYELYKMINHIPTDGLISNWGRDSSGRKLTFLDGSWIDVEAKKSGLYGICHYGNPSAQVAQVSEAKEVSSFIKNVNTFLKMHERYRKFVSSLKPGTYTNGSGEYITKLDTKIKEWYE